MSKIFAKAPSGTAERIAHVMKCFHPELFAAGVTIDLLSVADDDPECESALKVRGIPAYACVKINDVKARTLGQGDATIQIDEAKWLTLPDATKDSICDHELQHLEVVRDKKGRPKLDCAGRPKLKMRMHEIEFGWFACVAARHGSASIECKQAANLLLTNTQTLFVFALDGIAQKQQESRRLLEAAQP